MQPHIKEKFNSYPEHIQKHIMHIRTMILDTAEENNIEKVEETLKWGEPSYLVNGGSTLRIDWKAKKPDQYAVYFNCQTILIDTFKEIYGDTFSYEGKRAIVFQLSDSVPTTALKHCISLSLCYHKIKHLPLLGA